MDKLFDRLQMLEDRYEELGELLSDPDVIADTKRFMELSKEMADLRETVEKYNKYKQVIQQIKDDEEMIDRKSPSSLGLPASCFVFLSFTWPLKGDHYFQVLAYLHITVSNL